MVNMRLAYSTSEESIRPPSEVLINTLCPGTITVQGCVVYLLIHNLLSFFVIPLSRNWSGQVRLPGASAGIGLARTFRTLWFI